MAGAAGAGVEVVAHDADPRSTSDGIDAAVDARRRGTTRCSTGSSSSSRAPACRTTAPPVVAARARGIGVDLRDRARRAAASEPARSASPARTGRRRRRRCSGRSSRRRDRPVEVAGNIGRPLTSLVGAVDAGRLDRLRALVVPARGRRDAATAGRGADEPRAGPPRPARHVRGLRGDEAPRLRAPGRRGRRRRAARLRGCPRDARRVEFAADDPLPAEPRIRGAHNRENAAAATAAARAVGVPDEAIARALATFPGVEHRIEEVATIDGVLYVNDSKATNVAAALRALARSPDAGST